MIEPFGKELLGTTLHCAYEIRGEDAVFEDIPDVDLPEQMTGPAETIVDKKSESFDPEDFKDRYEEPVIALIQSKQSGAPLKRAQAAPRQSYVVNLMGALHRRIETSKLAGKQPGAARGTARAQGDHLREPRRKRSKSH